MNSKELADAFIRMSEAMQENRQMLCDLDGAIGDADHGVTMALGFSAVQEALTSADLPQLTLTDVFNLAAKTFLNAVGASAGPLYATAFMRAGASVKRIESIDSPSAVSMIEAMANGIQDRGKAVAGEKTMLDAWLPAAVAAKTCLQTCPDTATVQQILRAAADAAEEGAVSTRQMLATKGRASKLGERTIGHEDAGARSSALLLDALAS